MMMRVFALLAVLTGALTACGTEADSPLKLPSISTEPTSVQEEAPSTPTIGDMGPNIALDQAIKDLSRRLAVDESEIDVVSAQPGYWSDLGMGCPEDGVSYDELVVQGYRIELQVDGSVYVYHQGGTEPVFLCAAPEGDEFLPDRSLPTPSIPPPRG